PRRRAPCPPSPRAQGSGRPQRPPPTRTTSPAPWTTTPSSPPSWCRSAPHPSPRERAHGRRPGRSEMSEPKLTNAQIRQRRREAALKGARTRAAKQASAEAAEPIAAPEPAAPTARQLLERAQSIGREADLFYHAHLARC